MCGLEALTPFKIYFWKLHSRSDISINTINDAKNYTIGIVNQNVEHDFLVAKGFTKLQIVSQSIFNIKKLFHGRVDIIPYNDLILNFTLVQDKSLSEFNINQLERLVELKSISKEAYLVMNKNSSPQMIDVFKKGLQEVKNNGTYQRILIKYGVFVSP